MIQIHNWSQNNNMELNGTKFQVIRYGKNQQIKDDTLYLTGYMSEVIEDFTTLRDLGVILSVDGTFNDHVNHMVKKVRQKIGWVLRSIYTRSLDFMRQIYRSLILPHIDYCSQLYMPRDQGNIFKLENYKRIF